MQAKRFFRKHRGLLYYIYLGCGCRYEKNTHLSKPHKTKKKKSTREHLANPPVPVVCRCFMSLSCFLFWLALGRIACFLPNPIPSPHTYTGVGLSAAPSGGCPKTQVLFPGGSPCLPPDSSPSHVHTSSFFAFSPAYVPSSL